MLPDRLEPVKYERASVCPADGKNGHPTGKFFWPRIGASPAKAFPISRMSSGTTIATAIAGQEVSIVARGEKLGEAPVQQRCMSTAGRSCRYRALTPGIVIVACVLGGCAFSTQLKPTEPAGVTQQLVVRSLERALAELDISRFVGRKVTTDVHLQAGNEAFVKAFVTAWLEAHDVRVTSTSPELKLRVFVSVLGTDRNEQFIGLPSFQVPLVGVPTPELALFKRVRNRGQAETSIYAFDGSTDRFVVKSPAGVGLAKQDDYTVLLLITFTVSDVNKRAP